MNESAIDISTAKTQQRDVCVCVNLQWTNWTTWSNANRNDS